VQVLDLAGNIDQFRRGVLQRAIAEQVGGDHLGRQGVVKCGMIQTANQAVDQDHRRIFLHRMPRGQPWGARSMGLQPGDRQQRLIAPAHCVVCLGAIAITAYRLQPCLPWDRLRATRRMAGYWVRATRCLPVFSSAYEIERPGTPCVPMRKALAPV
jgi:hypothetical protein